MCHIGSECADAVVTFPQLFHQLVKHSAIYCSHFWAQSQHLSYLCPYSIILWLKFGTSLNYDKKSCLAAVFLTEPQSESFASQKGQVPYPDPCHQVGTSDYSNVMVQFKLLGQDYSWQCLSPVLWTEDEDEEFVWTVKLTNNVAERSVKLISD